MKNLKPLLLGILVFFNVNTSNAQANFWTLYNGSSITTTQEMNCQTASLSSLATPATYDWPPYQCINSAFNSSGSLLFAADIDGILDPSGSIFYKWLYTGGQCVSEVEIFPVPRSCYNYYVMAWDQDLNLRIVEVSTSHGTLSIISDNTLMTAGRNDNGTNCLIVADEEAAGVRNVYTADESASGTLNIRKWTFNSSTLPTTSTLLTSSAPLSNSMLTELTQDGDFTYVTSNYSTLNSYNINTGTTVTHTAPSGDNIVGFEFVPSLGSAGYWYISYQYAAALGGGGLGYFDVGGGTYNDITSTTVNMNDFHITDLELAKNGLLYLVGNPSHDDGVAGDGELAYIDVSSPTTATLPPTYVSIGGNPVYVIQSCDEDDEYYLGNQVDYENYNINSSTGSKGKFEINNQNSSISTCTAIPVCQTNIQLEFAPAPLGSDGITYDQQYQILWQESDNCGNPIPGGSSLDFTSDPPHWGPITNINLNTYGSMSLNSPSAVGKYFVVTTLVTDFCAMISYAAQKQLIYIQPDSTNTESWKIKVEGSYSDPSTSCSSAPLACDASSGPYIQLASTYPDIDGYYFVIEDLGPTCPGSPTIIYNGSASPTTISSGAGTITVDLSTLSGLSSYFSSHIGDYYIVDVYTHNGCGWKTLGDRYFKTTSGCKPGRTSSLSEPNQQSPNLSFSPIPAHSNLIIKLSGLDNSPVSIQLYNITGQKVEDLVNLKNATGDKKISVDISSIPTGLYFYKSSINGITSTGRITISH